jgi:dTDP-4-amino-4,6-dideoxygalactose transaminase
LKYLDKWNQKRRKAAAFYISRLKENNEFILPYNEQNKKHVYHVFVIRCKHRDRLIELLDKKNISWGMHYPKALPFLDAYSYKKHHYNDFAIAGNITNEIISIPIYPEITEMQLNIVCEQLLKYDK